MAARAVRCGAAPAAPAASGEGQPHAALTAPSRRYCGSRPPPARPFPATSPGAEPAVPHPPPASAARDCWYRPSLTPSLRPIHGLLPRGRAPPSRWAGLLDPLRTALLNPLHPGPAHLNSLDADSRLSCFSLPPHPAYMNRPLTSLRFLFPGFRKADRQPGSGTGNRCP